MFLGDEIDPDRATSPWAGHRDFVYDLIRWRQPAVAVELGTHFGCSLFAFIQALSDANCGGSIHAVDSWKGDPHAGYYGEEVFETFSANLAMLKERMAPRRIEVQVDRKDFSEALSDFEADSIDLLHIDGYHTYEALSEDFESWLPKLASNGVVLLHDTSPKSGYGSSDYYAERIEPEFPGFSFNHSFGLGVVLPKGEEGWDFLFSEEFDRCRESYKFQAESRRGQRAEADLMRLVEEKVEGMTRQAELIDERNRTISAQAELIDERNRTISAQAELIDERNRTISAQAELIDERDRRIERLEWERGSMDELLGMLPRELDDARARIVELENSPREQVKAFRHNFPRNIERKLRLRAKAHRAKHVLRPRTRIREFRNRRRQKQLGSGGEEASPGNSASDGFRSIPAALSLGNLFEEVAKSRPALTPNDLLETLVEGGDPSRFVVRNLERTVVEADSSSDCVGSPSGQRSFSLHGSGNEVAGGLAQLIERTEPDLISVDVWNTLIGRRRPADAAKTATGRRICLLARVLPRVEGMDPFSVAALRQQIEAEMAAVDPVEEYELTKVLANLLKRLGHPENEGLAKLSAELAGAELNDEIEWSHSLEDVHAVVSSRDEETVLLSDFYMTSENLGTVVREVTGLDLELKVSVDSGCSKRLGGALFEQLREERAVSGDRHLHVGDHPEADVANQVATGGVAVFVPAPDDFPAPGHYTKYDLSSCWSALDRDLAALAADETDHFRRAGIELAPLAVFLVARAIEEAHLKGTDRVHYLSREGSFLARVHEAIEPLLSPPGRSAIRAIHLPLSRRSTFAASLDEPFLGSMLRMWTMYPNQTVEAMLVSLGLDPEDCGPALGRAGLRVPEELDHAPSDPRVQALFDDREFLPLLREHVSFQKSALREFVGGITDLDGDDFLAVDIGWRGTIQDNLVRALDIRSSTGFYLGLFPFLNPQPDGCRKIGVAFDANQGDEFDFAEPPGPIERAWTPDTPSMIGFHRVGAGFGPVWHGETGSTSSGVEAFQEGTSEAAPIVARWLAGMGLTIPLLRDGLLDRARRAWLVPPSGLADIWFDSDHDDTFGGLSQLTGDSYYPNPSWLEGSLRKHLRKGARLSGWPAGYRAWAPVRGTIALVQDVTEQGGE